MKYSHKHFVCVTGVCSEVCCALQLRGQQAAACLFSMNVHTERQCDFSSSQRSGADLSSQNQITWQRRCVITLMCIKIALFPINQDLQEKPMIHWLLHSTGDSHVMFVTLSSRTFSLRVHRAELSHRIS